MNEEFATICFQIISYAGDAKSCYMEALEEAKQGNYNRAQERIQEGDDSFAQGHHVHADLIQKEAAGEQIPASLLLIHAEDQMMSAETLKLVVEELIELYRGSRDQSYTGLFS